LGAYGRKLRARKGPAIAIKAVARKLAGQLIARKRKSLEKLALELNMELVNSQPLA